MTQSKLLPGIQLRENVLYKDSRGCFSELYREDDYPIKFVQDNYSVSKHGVLRGLHYQLPLQVKLVTILQGSILDVVVDIRKNSPYFGKYNAINLDSRDYNQLFIPEGFAHGFCVLSDEAHVYYKCSDIYNSEKSYTIAYNDPFIGIEWPDKHFIISDKDLMGQNLLEIDKKLLPVY